MTILRPSMSTFSIDAHCSVERASSKHPAICCRAQLFDKVRFDNESRHDDWGFLLRLSKQIGARIETVPEVLVIALF